jgi:hypothetical protein
MFQDRQRHSVPRAWVALVRLFGGPVVFCLWLAIAGPLRFDHVQINIKAIGPHHRDAPLLDSPDDPTTMVLLDRHPQERVPR